MSIRWLRLPVITVPLVAVVAGWSPAARAGEFIRGDANQDAGVDISDALFTLNFLFLGEVAPLCPAAADVNDDERLDIADPQYTLNFLFLGGPPPRPPYPDAGRDPTPGLGCGLEPPAGLTCSHTGPRVELRWRAGDGYDEIEVRRAGEVVATLPGDATAFTDRLPAGGALEYTVRGRLGDETTDGAVCRVAGVPANSAPAIVILSPRQGAVTSGDTLTIRGRVDDVDDDGAVVRVLVAGEEVTPAGPPAVPYTFTADVSLSPGPQLIRCEAVDDFGRATFAELAVGREPVLRTGAASTGVVLHLSGSSGYDEIEAILTPFLDAVPALLDTGVRGVVLYRGGFLGADITVTGRSAEVVGPIGIDLFPAAGGTRVGMRVDIQTVRVHADGETDFGFLGTDSWQATWTGNSISLTGTFAFAPAPDGDGVTVTSDGFVADIASSSTAVSGFLDPLGIFDGLVNFLTGLFEDDIRSSVKTAVQDTANQALLPTIAETFSALRLNLDLGPVRLDTSHHDVVESAAGLAIIFDALWTGAAVAPGFPAYPGSAADFAPVPAMPLAVPAGHPVDLTIALSEDTLDQALHELVGGGLLESDLDLSAVDSPIQLTAGVIAGILDPRLATLPGVAADTPVGLRLRARQGPAVKPGAGIAGAAVVPLGAPWRYLAGRSEPPSTWPDADFRDAGWLLAPSGFGYSSDPLELLAVETELDDMAAGEYLSLYLRTTFELADPADLRGLVLRVLHDDGFVAYLNGAEIARRNVTGAPPRHDTPADRTGEPTWSEVDLLGLGGILRRGTNVLALQGHNAATTSSDFLLAPELRAAGPTPPGVMSSVPAQIEMRELELTFLADTDADGIGAADLDGDADEVELFGYTVGLSIQAELQLARDDGGAPVVSFAIDTADGDDPDSFPDAIIGGAAGLDIAVASEAIDIDDGTLLDFAWLVVALFGPSLGDALAGFELPVIPLPELAFDIDGDGTPEVRLDITRATLAPVDTDGGTPDWIAILADIRPAAR